jgi:mannose-6-phosphate isomerase-like protein (cupin superfamily)
MNEQDKAACICLQGEDAERALAAFSAQVREWGVTMPDVAPLVLDFGLGDFENTGLIEYWIANEEAAGYCGKYLFVFDGQTCPEHQHRDKHETFFVVKGRVRMVFDGAEREMGPGDVLPVPQGTPHAFTGVGPALLLELSTPCVVADNNFSDERIPIGRSACSGSSGEGHGKSC